MLQANVCKLNVTRFPYEIGRLAEDIAGGLMVTMPSERDMKSDLPVGKKGETIGEICEAYLQGKADVKTEDRMRVLRFLENICIGAGAVGYRTESLHGAGSPQAQRIMITRQGSFEAKKRLAKKIAGIKED
jgi:4-hydroxybutyryl-CoA dehydratase/vinylacetyl-CoA-Delta-isomerase